MGLVVAVGRGGAGAAALCLRTRAALLSVAPVAALPRTLVAVGAHRRASPSGAPELSLRGRPHALGCFAGSAGKRRSTGPRAGSSRTGLRREELTGAVALLRRGWPCRVAPITPSLAVVAVAWRRRGGEANGLGFGSVLLARF
jgi:hypothetical protein